MSKWPDQKPGTVEIGEPQTDGKMTIITYKVSFKPLKFPPGVWYYKKYRSDNGWEMSKLTRVYPWNDTYWWKARYRRTVRWIKKNV